MKYLFIILGMASLFLLMQSGMYSDRIRICERASKSYMSENTRLWNRQLIDSIRSTRLICRVLAAVCAVAALWFATFYSNMP